MFLGRRGAWFLDWIPKVQRNANLIDLLESFPTSIYYLLSKIGSDTAEKESLKVCQKVARQSDRMSGRPNAGRPAEDAAARRRPQLRQGR